MGSTPKETTSKVEPWDGSKPFLEDIYKQYNDLISKGAPLPYEGKTIADQSKATTDALMQAENLARNGNTSALTNANKAVNQVMNSSGNTQANKTLSQLQNGTSLGTNPTDAIAQMIGAGKTAQAPGQFNQQYTNPAVAQTANAGNYNNAAVGQAANYGNFTNGAASQAQQLGNYNNAAIGQAANAGNFTNGAAGQAQQLANYNNAAVGQAANYGNFTNAGIGAQQAQANNLANGSNPAMDYLRSTASGEQIGKNPYLDQAIANSQDQIATRLQNVTNPALMSQAAAAGRMGSNAFGTGLNNAQNTAANEMSRVAVDAYQNQYNQDRAAQQAAAGQYGNFYNQDQQNQMEANANLANTSNAQQQQRLAGTQLFGNLNDSQQQQRLSANQNYADILNSQQSQRLAGTQLYGNLNDSQQQQRLAANQNYADILNSQQQNRMQGTQIFGNLNDAQQSQRLAGSQLYGNLNDAQQTQRMNAANSANQQFNANRDYQMAGLNLASNNYQNSIQNMLGIRDQQMNAANSQISANQNANAQKLQAAGMAGDVYQNQFMPSQYLSNVGQQYDNRADLELQSKINAWDRQQQQPLQNLGNFANLLNGGGYSNTTTPVYTNTAGQILGGLGSLAGLFALCDIREKILHRFVGFMPLTNGETIGMFEFSYKDDPETKWIGPLAQEVEDKTGAVVEFEGKLHVDVAALIGEAA